jgi:uncharacterized damage-inducible protein DinB
MSNQWIVDSIDHMEWANHRARQSIVDAGGHAGARKLFAHILAAESIWQTRIVGGDTSTIAVFPDRTLEECHLIIDISAGRFRELIDGFEPERVIEYTDTKGNDHSNTVGETLTHVFAHGSYHRGQIATLLREAGHEPAVTDVIAWVRD